MRESTDVGRVVEDPFTAGRSYNVIYADPPWHYRDRASAGARGAGYKYPLLSDADIARLPVERIAADDAVLLLWVTWPKLPEVLPIIDAWGFRYKTVGFVWVKRTIGGKLAWGMGSWTRANTEPCLLAVRGRPKREYAGVHQVIEAMSPRHSAKPPEVRDRIVELVGDLPRIELFARVRAPGWDVWGNDVSSNAVLADSTQGPILSLPAGADTDALKRRVVENLAVSGRTTRRQAAALCAIEPTAAGELLAKMLADGVVVRHGRLGGTYYVLADAPVAVAAGRAGTNRAQHQRRVIRHVEAHGVVTRGEVAMLLDLAPAAAGQLLRRLVDAGHLLLEGRKRAARYRLAGKTEPRPAPDLPSDAAATSAHEWRILEHVSTWHRITRAEAAALFELEPIAAGRLLQRLVDAGALVRRGRGRGARYEAG